MELMGKYGNMMIYDDTKLQIHIDHEDSLFFMKHVFQSFLLNYQVIKGTSALKLAMAQDISMLIANDWGTSGAAFLLHGFEDPFLSLIRIFFLLCGSRPSSSTFRSNKAYWPWHPQDMPMLIANGEIP